MASSSCAAMSCRDLGSRRCSTTQRDADACTSAWRPQGVDVLFLAPSADLEYLTGVERQIPSFGEASYAHGWVTGAFFRPGADPVFLFPRMFAAFDLREEPEGEVIVVSETDDGPAIFERAAARHGAGRHRRGRRQGLGRDGAPPRPRLRLRPAANGLAARQRAAARKDGGGARCDGPRDRDRRACDGGRSAARRAGRHDGRPRRGRRARAPRGRLTLPFVHDPHLHRPRRRRLRLRKGDRAHARSRREPR